MKDSNHLRESSKIDLKSGRIQDKVQNPEKCGRGSLSKKSRIVGELRNKKETKDKLQMFQSLEDTRTKIDSTLMRAQWAIREMRRQSRTAKSLVESGVDEQEVADTGMQAYGIDLEEEKKSLEYLEQDVERERVEFSSFLKIGWKAVQQVSEKVEMKIEEIQQTSEAV